MRSVRGIGDFGPYLHSEGTQISGQRFDKDWEEEHFLNDLRYDSREEAQAFADRVAFRVLKDGLTLRQIVDSGISAKGIGTRYADPVEAEG